jgi:hypothetical protein
MTIKIRRIAIATTHVSATLEITSCHIFVTSRHLSGRRVVEIVCPINCWK